MSFSMIFSILVIAAIIAVAFYAITYFISLKSCTELGLFGRELQDKIDEAWNADSVKTSFEQSVPSDIKKVCIGNIELASRESEEWKVWRNYAERGNLFFYPPLDKCDVNYKKLNHVEITGFECLNVINGKAKVDLEKEVFDDLVKLS